MLLLTTLFFFASLSSVLAGNLTHGQNCSVGESRLQVGSYQFYDMCDTRTFCNGTSGTCDLKNCRRDVYPFGYNHTKQGDLPPTCELGSFCPDEEDACQPLLPVGSPCQLNRDDQCAPPPNWKQLADRTPYGLNKNGSICLNNVCMYANVTLGQACQVENTPYIGYAASTEFIYIVSRHNCIAGTYCDSQNKVCVQNRLLGQTCSADKECETFNCMETGVCGKAPQTPNHVGVYVYVLVALGILGALLGTLATLFITHRRQRDIEREKRAQYWREQHAFRQDLDNMRQSARMSIMSMSQKGSNRSTTYSNRSTVYEDANAGEGSSVTTPLTAHAATKASGLRQQYIGDEEEDDDEEITEEEQRK